MAYHGPMSVSTSESKVGIPYSCRCAWCGAAFTGTDEIKACGHVFKPGYFNEIEKKTVGFSSGLQASYNMKYELEYAEKRLEHYRKTVKEGKLKEYLRTGRPKKEDWFRVEEGSALEDYLKSTDGKTNNEYQRDKNRLKEFPYIWKLFSEETNVKCPECGKLQPWCYDTGCSNAKLLIIFAMLALFFGSFFLWPSIVESLSPSANRMIILGIFVLPILVGILLFKMIRKITVSRYAKMPWNADDLPVYDAEYISEFRRLNWPEPGKKAGK